MMFAELLDPVFRPLLNLHPLLAVGLVSLLVSVIITVIYKYTTNQTLMKRLKTEMKELQKEMKTLKEHPKEMMKVQKQAMDTNMKYMMQSFKSTLYTFLPIIIIFAWMNANYAFEPITPGEQFQATLEMQKGALGEVSLEVPEGIEIIGDSTQQIVENKVVFNMKGKEGEYIEGEALKFDYNDNVYFKDVIITEEDRYAKVEDKGKDSYKSVKLSNRKKIVLPLLNWGWLGSYILFSIVFSMLLRKVMKVY